MKIVCSCECGNDSGYYDVNKGAYILSNVIWIFYFLKLEKRLINQTRIAFSSLFDSNWDWALDIFGDLSRLLFFVLFGVRLTRTVFVAIEPSWVFEVLKWHGETRGWSWFLYGVCCPTIYPSLISNNFSSSETFFYSSFNSLQQIELNSSFKPYINSFSFCLPYLSFFIIYCLIYSES